MSHLNFARNRLINIAFIVDSRTIIHFSVIRYSPQDTAASRASGHPPVYRFVGQHHLSGFDRFST